MNSFVLSFLQRSFHSIQCWKGPKLQVAPNEDELTILIDVDAQSLESQLHIDIEIPRQTLQGLGKTWRKQGKSRKENQQQHFI